MGEGDHERRDRKREQRARGEGAGAKSDKHMQYQSMRACAVCVVCVVCVVCACMWVYVGVRLCAARVQSAASMTLVWLLCFMHMGRRIQTHLPCVVAICARNGVSSWVLVMASSPHHVWCARVMRHYVRCNADQMWGSPSHENEWTTRRMKASHERYDVVACVGMDPEERQQQPQVHVMNL